MLPQLDVHGAPMARRFVTFSRTLVTSGAHPVNTPGSSAGRRCTFSAAFPSYPRNHFLVIREATLTDAD